MTDLYDKTKRMLYISSNRKKRKILILLNFENNMNVFRCPPLLGITKKE